MFKKRDSCTTAAQVLERNTGMPAKEFTKHHGIPKINGLDEAVKTAKKFVKEYPERQVWIVGDYDADGICSTAIMYWTFIRMRVKPVTRLPKRFSEGYGLSPKIIEEIPAGSLVITVDNGIAANEAVHEAKKKGMTVIITDHHLPRYDEDGNMLLPEADVIVDPHTDNSEFEDYCGAGLAYRFAQAMFPGLNLLELKSLAAVATVADVVPLAGANRDLVIEGLAALNHRRNVPGMEELLEDDRLVSPNPAEISHVTEDDFGFRIGPMLNAPGRLEDDGASYALKLLKTPRGSALLGPMAAELIRRNNERKEIAKKANAEAEAQVTDQRPIVVYDPGFGEGIIGLVAGHLTEKYTSPSVAFTRSAKPGILKGSARSVPEVHLKNALDSMSDLMTAYGGHAGAAGLSIPEENLNAFKKAFAEACGPIPKKSDIINYDLELDPNHIEEAYAAQVPLAPFGEGNPKILYHMVYDAQSEARFIGDGSHFMIRDRAVTLMGFGMAEKYKKAGCPKHLDMVGHLSQSWFRGVPSFKFEIVSFC